MSFNVDGSLDWLNSSSIHNWRVLPPRILRPWAQSAHRGPVHQPPSSSSPWRGAGLVPALISAAVPMGRVQTAPRAGTSLSSAGSPVGALWDLEALGRLEGHRGEEGFCTFSSNTPRSPCPPPAHPPPQSLFQGLLLGWGAGERRRAEPDGSLPEDCWGRGGPVPSLSSVQVILPSWSLHT